MSKELDRLAEEIHSDELILAALLYDAEHPDRTEREIISCERQIDVLNHQILQLRARRTTLPDAINRLRRKISAGRKRIKLEGNKDLQALLKMRDKYNELIKLAEANNG